VNVWLNFTPFDVKPFPETMLDKMSGHGDGANRATLSFAATSSEELSTLNVYVKKNGEAVLTSCNTTPTVPPGSARSKPERTREFLWPMGDCGLGESIRASIPLGFVRAAAERGENVRIRWERGSNGVQLVRNDDKDNKDEPSSATKRRRIGSSENE